MRYLTLDYWANLFGYTKASRLELTQGEPTHDEDHERMDISHARATREALRWMSANNADIASVNQADRSGIIGQGVNIQCRNKKHPETNRPIEEFIRKWSKKQNCELTGRWHANGLYRSMVEFENKDGGFLVRHHYNTRWPIPYRPELIELGMIDAAKYDEEKRIFNGLKRDRYGRITHIYIYDSQRRTTSSPVSAKELTYYAPVWITISQYTAVSRLSAALPTIDKLDRYSDAELQAALERAKAGKYWKTVLYDDIMKVVRNLKDQYERKTELTTLMAAIRKQGVSPQGLSPIPREDEIVTGDRPSDTIYGDLTTNSKQNIASAAGMSSQIVYQDPSKSNYSAIKAMMAFASIYWSTRFDDLCEMVLSDIMYRVIRAGVEIGEVDAPGFHEKPDDFLNLDYMRVSEIDIEPKKTADADKQRLENGTISKRELVRRRGRDYEAVIEEQIDDEILREQIRARKYAEAGIPLPGEEK